MKSSTNMDTLQQSLKELRCALDRVLAYVPDDCLPHDWKEAESFGLLSENLNQIGQDARYFGNICYYGLQEWENENV